MMQPRMIGELLEKSIDGEVLNFGGKERFSRYELGEILCEEAGFDKNLLVKKQWKKPGLLTKLPMYR